jgi:hypothetical protein
MTSIKEIADKVLDLALAMQPLDSREESMKFWDGVNKILDAAFAEPIKTTFTNKSKRAWSEEECRVMVNAALAKLIDDAGGVITISVKDLFRVAPMRTLAMALSDDDKILTLTRIPRDS